MAGARGAVRSARGLWGLWCMHWRLEKGERWDDLKGEPAKRRMKALVAAGKARGAMRSWRRSGGLDRLRPAAGFPRLDRARTLACEIRATCGHSPASSSRRAGGTGRRRRAARACAQGAPPAGHENRGGLSVNLKPGQRLPNAFAWTGTHSLFRDAGFELAGAPTTSKLRMRRKR